MQLVVATCISTQILFERKIIMQYLYILVVISLFVGNSTLAAEVTCDTQANEKKMTGAAKTNFVKKCNLTATSAVTSCEGQATSKKLTGASKTSFIRKCYEGSQVPVPKDIYCKSVADEKRLKDLSKTAFVKKCIKGGMVGKKAK
jgi:hypothetical protein